MAFVILSAGDLTRSRTRTLSLKLVLALMVMAMLLVLALGFALGAGLRAQLPIPGVSEAMAATPAAEASVEAHIEAPAVAAAEPASPPQIAIDQRLLIDRFGELSGRMTQLETEARDLAFRIGVVKDADARGERAEAAEKPGRLAKTPPGTPSGGPLLPPGPEIPLRREQMVDQDLEVSLDMLEEDIESLAGLIAEVDRSVTEMNLAHMARPGREPVRGVKALSSFGNRLDPFTRKRAFHSGIDYPAPRGTPIYASAGGRIIFSGYRSNYGNTVEIDHGGGLVTRYAHASALLVKVGQVVMPGEKIARVGTTGRSTGNHLHFEILRDGRFVDPKVYLAQF